MKRVYRTRIAVVLLGVCALANVRSLPRDVREYRAPKPDAPQRIASRFEPLHACLPEGVVTGFYVDESHTDPEGPHRAARLFLTQYALSPHLVADSTAHRLVVVDSDEPETVPEIAAASQWTLIADLHNGVRLYRTGPEE